MAGTEPSGERRYRARILSVVTDHPTRLVGDETPLTHVEEYQLIAPWIGGDRATADGDVERLHEERASDRDDLLDGLVDGRHEDVGFLR